MANDNLYEKNFVDIIKELSEIRTTVDISFKNFEKTLSVFAKTIEELSKTSIENDRDIEELKKSLKELMKAHNELKKNFEKKVEEFERKLKKFMRKIDWKKISLYIGIISGISAGLVSFIHNISKIREFLIKLLR